MQARDLGGVDERLGLCRRETAKPHGESICEQVGEPVERVVVVIGRVSAGGDGRGGDAGPHGSVS